MNKVICDICGTSYPSTAKKCPICGSSREYALENTEDSMNDFDFLETEESTPVPRKKSREIFDYDEVNQVKSTGRKLEEEDFDDEEEDYEEEAHTNVGLVIVLVVLIVLLLLTAGFFFVRYLLPGMMPAETQPIETAAPVQTEPVETTVPGKPCTNLMMDGGKMELARDGKKLLNVRVYPEDTTDELTFVSGDESIVTVSENGTVTAVGEGQTVITITCGQQQINCNVTVDYSIGEETVPPEEIPAMQVEGEDETTSSDVTEATDDTQATESATEATAEATTAEPKLKLKKTDITIRSNRTSVTLELDCDIKPEDIKWFTMDSTIAIVHDGVVTAIGAGQTRIYGEYGGEQVECIVRCIF
ncbi:MAG: Ig domain-containing protein [Faecousia sp.]